MSEESQDPLEGPLRSPLKAGEVYGGFDREKPVGELKTLLLIDPAPVDRMVDVLYTASSKTTQAGGDVAWIYLSFTEGGSTFPVQNSRGSRTISRFLLQAGQSLYASVTQRAVSGTGWARIRVYGALTAVPTPAVPPPPPAPTKWELSGCIAPSDGSTGPCRPH